ncbi:hypothetical protein VTL71DRAFT_4338 [Oculimacula yallundae]|uniref:CENP-V/GFA domain-containing protein n=1 Tax=Oculimacula yallundae TaxID=86028 RepID=A0ABR4C3D9_9HELO
MAATADKSKPYIPLSNVSQDGWSKEDSATATCLCGAVQLEFPTKAPGLVNTFVCNCTDCHKITASMYASNFTVLNTHFKHLRGQENLKTFAQSTTIGFPPNKNTMTNFFCQTCGTLMYRQGSGWPSQSFLRIGTVDDFMLMETVLRPQVQQFCKDRLSWVKSIEGIPETQGLAADYE